VLGIVANLAPWGSFQRAIIFFTVTVCIEDFTRTWFVVRQVRNDISLAVVSLAFAIAISFVEMATELLIIVSTYDTFRAAADGGVEVYDIFFSSYSGPLAMIGFDVTRPIDHFLLCMSMYYAWQMRHWFLYSALVLSHIVLDLIIDRIWNRDPLNSYVPILGISLLFTMLWCLATFWIRATAKRRSVEDAQNVGATTQSRDTEFRGHNP